MCPSAIQVSMALDDYAPMVSQHQMSHLVQDQLCAGWLMIWFNFQQLCSLCDSILMALDGLSSLVWSTVHLRNSVSWPLLDQFSLWERFQLVCSFLVSSGHLSWEWLMTLMPGLVALSSWSAWATTYGPLIWHIAVSHFAALEVTISSWRSHFDRLTWVQVKYGFGTVGDWC